MANTGEDNLDEDEDNLPLHVFLDIECMQTPKSQRDVWNMKKEKGNASLM